MRKIVKKKGDLDKSKLIFQIGISFPLAEILIAKGKFNSIQLYQK